MKILEEENKRRHDETIGRYQQRLKELQKESEDDRQKMESMKKAEMALYTVGTWNSISKKVKLRKLKIAWIRNMLISGRKSREEWKLRLKSEVRWLVEFYKQKWSAKFENQQLIEQLKTAKDEMEKRHTEEKAWLGECKNKEIAEFKSILEQLNNEAEKEQKMHNEKMIELRQNLVTRIFSKK